MILLQYPHPDFKIKTANGRDIIWDAIRKRWVALTPEEWVRQNMVQYLLQVKNYPASVFALEKEIKLGELRKRFDIVVFKEMLPWMVIECKEPAVSLSAKVLEQALRYNMRLSASYLLISNGQATFGWNIQNGRFDPISAMPGW